MTTVRRETSQAARLTLLMNHKCTTSTPGITRCVCGPTVCVRKEEQINNNSRSWETSKQQQPNPHITCALLLVAPDIDYTGKVFHCTLSCNGGIKTSCCCWGGREVGTIFIHYKLIIEQPPNNYQPKHGNAFRF